MGDHARKRREARERRNRVLYQPMQLGRFWYIVKWPTGEILPTGRLETFERATELIATYKAA